MKQFVDEDLTGAEFRECDLTRASLIGVIMQDAVIDGLVTNLVVNGVEVMAYVEAELDRRHPVRLLIRSDDPAELRRGWRQLRADWAATIERMRASPGIEHRSVNDEWSAVADPAPPGLRPRLVVPALLPRVDGAVHPDGAGDRVRARPRGAGPRPVRRPDARRGRARCATSRRPSSRPGSATVTPEQLAGARRRCPTTTAGRRTRAAGRCGSASARCSTRTSSTTASACATST